MKKRHTKPAAKQDAAGYFRIFTYRVDPRREPAFRRTYGPKGAWAGLFAKADGYLGTKLLRRTNDAHGLMTIDAWTSESAWLKFIDSYGRRYRQLSDECSALYLSESEIGSFSICSARRQARKKSA